VARLETLHAAAAADSAGAASCFEDPRGSASAPAAPDIALHVHPHVCGAGRGTELTQNRVHALGSSEAPPVGAYVLTTPFAAGSGSDDGSNRNGVTGWF
jgi:hypothetical protein